MTFNTGNPIGSTDARDLSDNAENFDTALGTTAATWVDRLGVTRDSFEGRLAKGSFYRVGDFATGYTLTNMRQTLEYSGHEYSWAGTFPKVVTAGATPATSGGISSTAWVDRTDLTLRSELKKSVIGVRNGILALNGFLLVSDFFDGVNDYTQDAIQAAVNFVGNAATSTKKIHMNAGVWDFTKPVVIHQKDGFNLRGDGRWSTVIKISGSMAPDLSVVSGFPADNSYRGYTYTDAVAAFIISARRVTGGAGGELNSSGGNGAAWDLHFSDFTVVSDEGYERTCDVFYAPEIAHSTFERINTDEMRYTFVVSDIYKTTIKDFDATRCVGPANHFSTGAHIASGTTLSLINAGSSRSTIGWYFNNLEYSNWSNVTAEQWGEYNTTITRYAYSLNNCRISMDGCGSEIADGVDNVYVKSFYFHAGCKITLNSCNFTCNVNSSLYTELAQVTDSRVVANSSQFSLSKNNDSTFTALPVLLDGTTSFIDNGVLGRVYTKNMFVVSGSAKWVTTIPEQKQEVYYYVNSYSLPSATAIQNIPHTIGRNPQLLSTGNGSGFVCALAGVYRVNWKYKTTGGNLQYTDIAVNGVQKDMITLNNVASTQYALEHDIEVTLSVGDLVTWRVRNVNGDATCVFNKSIVKVERIQ